MFSKLRSHHRRTGSNPTSPDLPHPQAPAFDNIPLPSPGFFEHQRQWSQEERAQVLDWQEEEAEAGDDVEPITFTPVSPLPPVLPPIPRIASVRKGAKSPPKRDRESFGINFDRTSLSVDNGMGALEERQEPLPAQESIPVKAQPTWSYGQGSQTSLVSDTSRRPGQRGSDGLSAEPMQKQASMASKSSGHSQASSGRSSKFDGHSSYATSGQRQGYKLDGQVSMAGAPLRQAHRQHDDQQAQMFQRLDRPQTLSMLRPHTAGSPTALRPKPELNSHASYGLPGHRGLQPSAHPAISPMAAVVEDARPMPPLAEHPALNAPKPVTSRSTASLTSQGFSSVAYDSARSGTPPTKHNAPGRPASPGQLPTVKSRSKLNLRNPMSLLLRRRSGHNLDTLQLPDEGLLLSINNRSELPDDYDPRIKGTKVHDFNAPRPPPRRVFTSPQTGQGPSVETAPPSKTKNEPVESPRPKRAHTPTAFLEHFDDETVPADDSGIRAEELANRDFVKRNSRELLGPDANLPLPPFAKKQSRPSFGDDPADGPVIVTPTEERSAASAGLRRSTPPIRHALAAPTPPPKDGGSIMPTPEDKIRLSQTVVPGGVPQLSPPKPRNRKSLGLPRHLDSRSSRFSFQLGGPEAQMQEKLLEERHKAKQAEKAMQAQLSEEEDEYDEDYYDNGFDDADMYGEEPIPGMDDEDPLDGPLSTFSLGSRNMSLASFKDGIKSPEIFATASQLPSSAEPAKLSDENPLGTIDVVAAARMALSSNPPSPATYSPNSLDARSIRFPSNASARPSIDRGRTSHEGSMRARFEESHSGSHSRTREVLPATEEHPEGMSAEICEDNGDDESEHVAPITEDLGEDMYFDDGMIEDPGDEEDVMHFNEETFDDPSSQFYERKPINGPIPGQQNFVSAARISTGGELQSQRASVDQVEESKRVTSLASNARPISDFSYQQYRGSMRKSHLSGFTTLEAYHGALAQAATQAAVDGRFTRRASQVSEVDRDTRQIRYSDSSIDSEPPPRPATLESSGQSLVQDDRRTSNTSSFQSAHPRSSSEDTKPDGLLVNDAPSNGLVGHNRASSGLGFDPMSFNYGETTDLEGYDDDDDPMIAAANAEALANDDEGEYGREFGFYAAPPTLATMINTHLRGGDSGSVSGSEDGSEVEYANGGYFGPKGIDTIERTKSLREPNLTPITERSEFSNRNSCISLFGLHSSGGPVAPGLTPASAGPLPSPGLAQLARMSPFPSEHDEMSMENLRKLRRGAFGDGRGGSMSDLSNAGSSSPRNSSPVASAAGHMLPRHSQLQYSSHAAAVGWLNGVGVGLPSSDGLERLGEDDESSSGDEHGDNEDDEADEHAFEEHDASPNPDSPTITASDGYQISSPSTTMDHPPGSPGIYKQRNAATHNLTLITTSPSPPSPPPQPVLFNPATPRSALTGASSSPHRMHTPITAHRTSTAPHAPSSPSPLPRPQQSSSRASVPHSPAHKSPAHSRNSSRNEEGVSVAYVMEKDEERGGQRWVLERRRTSEVGETVVVGREVVTGGRI